MKLFVRSVVIASLLEFIYAIELLVASEFQNTLFQPSDIKDWSNKQVFKCDTTDFQEFSDSNIFGIFGKTVSSNKKSLSSLPPHWSASVRFDMLLYQGLELNDKVEVRIDNQSQGIFKKSAINYGYSMCGNKYKDSLILYSKNITHTSSTMEVSFTSTFDQLEDDEGYGIKNFFVYVDTCYQTCASCNGPSYNQCLSCPDNSSRSGNTCSCDSGYYLHEYKCVPNCPTGFSPDSKNKICLVHINDIYCLSCIDDPICQNCRNCDSSKLLFKGTCVSKCPFYTTQKGNECIDLKQQNINGTYLALGLFDNKIFGESEVYGLGFKTTGFLGTSDNTSSGAKVTRCSASNLLGGAYLSGQNAVIQLDYTGLSPHWSIAVRYDLYLIDTWDYEFSKLTIDSKEANSQEGNYLKGSNRLCGMKQFTDQIKTVSVNITHDLQSLSLSITNNLNDNTFDESFGINNFYILVDYDKLHFMNTSQFSKLENQCVANCDKCDASGCLKCKSGYFLYDRLCYQTCPDNTFANSPTTCCHSACKECQIPGNQNSCTICKSGFYLIDQSTCSSSCPQNQYWTNDSDMTCPKCDITCFQCKSPGNSNSCLACSGSYYLSNNKCVKNCDPGFTKITATNNNTCQKCEDSCLTCNGLSNDNCLSCQRPSLFLNNKKCVTDCNPNQFKNTDNQSCTNCHSTCATCSGSLISQCSSCSGSLFLHLNKCIQTCPNGFYKNTQNNACSSCDSTCETCDAFECKTCNSGNYLTEKLCKSACPPGTYANSQTKTCDACDTSCKECKSPGTIYYCTKCKSDTFLNPDDSCQSSCPISFWKTSDLTCKQCHQSCYSCQSPGDENSCLACSGIYYLQNNKCVETCNPGFTKISATNNNTCQRCNSSCLTCDGLSKDNCLSCQKPSLFLNNQTCVTDCNPNQFKNTDNQSCTNCHSTCATCSGSLISQCSSCSGSLFLHLNKCIQTCPNGFYKNTQNNACSSCDSTCETCDAFECKTCKSGNYLTEKQCKSVCPPGTYANSDTKTCDVCDSSCKECKSSGTKSCTKCKSNTYLNPDESCKSSCPISYWKESDLTCKQCHQSCYSCQSPGDENSCLACSGIYYLQNNKCVENCNSGFTKISATNNNTCQRCNSSCLTCDGLSKYNCLSCQKPSLFLNNQTCVTDCNPNQFKNTDNQSCTNCHSTCATCSGSLISQCSSCSGSLFFYQNKCIQTCPNGFYKNTQNNVCSSCDNTCETCDAFECKTCKSGNYLTEKQCKSVCPPGTYANSDTKTCDVCDSSCKECKSSGTKSCTKCKSNTYLNPDESCKSSCPISYWKESDLTCKKCDQSCYSCQSPGDANSCLACTNNLYLHENKCEETCNIGYVKITESNNNTCQKCHNSCLSCDGLLKNNCLTCQRPQFFLQSDNSCVADCNSNQFKNTQNQQCDNCHPTCSTCSGNLNTQCQSCKGSLFLDKNQCIETCPSGYYQNKQNNECSQCDPTCKTCSEDVKMCTSCTGTLYLYKNSCVSICPSNYYQNKSNNECTQCESTCKTCDNRTNSDCLSCYEGQFYHKETKECLTRCPLSYYIDQVNKLCIKCLESCLKCESNDICVSCQEGYFLEGNSCISQCKDGFYGNKLTKTCDKCNPNCKTCFGPSENECNCHHKCRTSCSGPEEEDCLTIKVQYSIIFYILIFKSGLWVSSFIWGIFKDSQVQMLSKVKPQTLNDLQYQKPEEKQENILMTPQQKIQPNDQDIKRKKEGTLVDLDLQYRQQTQTIVSQNNLINNIDLNNNRQSRRLRTRFTQNILKTSTSIMDSPQTMNTSPLKKQSSDNIDTLQSFALNKQKKTSQTGLRSSQVMSSIFQQKAQTSKKYETNQKLKYILIGNEWISLFRLNDSNVSRSLRTTLIYLKYQAFLFATQFIYDFTIKYIAICFAFGWSVKFFLSRGLNLIGSQSKIVNIVVNVAFQGLLFCHLFYWFIPQLMDLFLEKDQKWSIFYGIIFSSDFFIFQQIFSFFEYIFTIKYLNCKNQQGMKTKLLEIFKCSAFIKYITN